MTEKNSHCSYCGAPFPGAEWPRACSRCRERSYLNPLPVAVVLLPVGDGVLVIRRNTEPRKGTLTLPGGYIDSGETWQEAARRELREEAGIALDEAAEIRLIDVMNGIDDTIVVFGLGPHLPFSALRPYACDETQEVTLITEPVELGFPTHTEIVRRFFAGEFRR